MPRPGQQEDRERGPKKLELLLDRKRPRMKKRLRFRREIEVPGNGPEVDIGCGECRPDRRPSEGLEPNRMREDAPGDECHQESEAQRRWISRELSPEG